MSQREPHFNPDDVRKVARAIGSGLYTHEVGRNEHVTCQYCGAWQYADYESDYKDFQHKLDCVVLVAKDLLTGAPK